MEREKHPLETELMQAVRDRLAGQGVKQAVTAKILGVHQSEISQIRRGIAQTSLGKLLVIAKGLGITVEFKLGECEPASLAAMNEPDSGAMTFDDHEGLF